MILARCLAFVASVATLWGLPTWDVPRPSDGCSMTSAADTVSAASGLLKRHMHVADFEMVERSYWIEAPPRPVQPASLLIVIHGQTLDAATEAANHNFAALGEQQNLMVVYPQGMDDSYPGEDQGTGWNVGSAGDNNTCVPQGVGGAYGCYKSCRALKKCGRCNWSTCYDDVLFLRDMIKKVSREFCIDLDRVYGQGESNGAEMLHHLVREMPETFAGIATWFGTPLAGYLLGNRLQVVGNHNALSQTAFLAFHGRNDTTIPPGGGVSDSGWLFEPLEQSTGMWAAVHRCDNKATLLETRWDGGTLDFRCFEYRHCHSGRRVVQCMYDGVHGDCPSGNDGDQMTMWFLRQFRRGAQGTPFSHQAAVAPNKEVVV